MITDFRGYYGFLSNFHPISITYQGITYPSSEHAFQAAKTRSHKRRQYIANLPTAASAKRAGRELPLRDDWEEVKLRVMENILRIKFQDITLRRKLTNTYPDKLVEGNTWGDTYWGCQYKYRKWVGENHLGKILMKIRKDYL